MCKVADLMTKVGIVLTDKTEWSQAVARVAITLVFALHFTLTQSPVVVAVLAFSAVAAAWAAWVHHVPSVPQRTYASCILDNVGISTVLFFAGPGHPGLVLMYLWLLIGNGYRYSTFHAALSGIATIATFWPAVLLSSKWDGFLYEAMEITLGFVLVSWFVSKLMANLEQSIRDVRFQEQRAERLETKVLQDGLTGLCNREFATDYLTKHARRGTKLGILFVDLDNFKRFNDQYGHHVGDQVLINISKRLQHCVRENDFVCRYAGDEFVVLINDDDKNTINIIAKRIQTEMNTPIGIHESPSLRVTGSIGIAVMGDDANTAHDILKAADAAMYLAKRQGRNQIAWYEENKES